MEKIRRIGRRRKGKYVDPAIDKFAVVSARNLLMGSLISMGWRLALTVLLPIFIGVKIDARFDSSPSATLAAFIIAVFAASLLMYNTYNDINSQMISSESKKGKKRPSSENTSNTEDIDA